MSTEQDKLLFSKVKEGDRASFNVLFKKHYNRLCNFARGILKSDDLSEGCVQEVFINLWENRHKIDVEKSVIAFLYTCVKNNAYNKLEKEKTRRIYEDRYADMTETKTVLDPSENSDTTRLSLILKQAIESLPAKCKSIFLMSRYEGLTYEEISEYMEISVKTVENQMGIAFQKLRAYAVPKYDQVTMLRNK